MNEEKNSMKKNDEENNQNNQQKSNDWFKWYKQDKLIIWMKRNEWVKWFGDWWIQIDWWVFYLIFSFLPFIEKCRIKNWQFKRKSVFYL